MAVAAFVIIDKCVKVEPSMGGVAKDIGMFCCICGRDFENKGGWFMSAFSISILSFFRGPIPPFHNSCLPLHCAISTYIHGTLNHSHQY